LAGADKESEQALTIYVDKWDWEEGHHQGNAIISMLKDVMQRNVTAICAAYDLLQWNCARLPVKLTHKITIVPAQELEDTNPSIGEVQPSSRDTQTLHFCKQAGIILL
jgi:asparagine synthetase A